MLTKFNNQKIETGGEQESQKIVQSQLAQRRKPLQGPALCVHLIESQLKRLERRDQFEVFVSVTCPCVR